MKLTKTKREALERYVLDSCLSSMFGSGQETNYLKNGFPAFKGISHMSDDELFNEAVNHSDADEVQDFLQNVKEPLQRYAVNVEVIKGYVIEVEAASRVEAFRKVEEMSTYHVERNGDYVDSHTCVDDDVELIEEE